AQVNHLVTGQVQHGLRRAVTRQRRGGQDEREMASHGTAPRVCRVCVRVPRKRRGRRRVVKPPVLEGDVSVLRDPPPRSSAPFYEKACCVKGPTWWPQPTSGRHAPRTTLLFALSEGAQIMGAPVQAGVRSSDAANSDNGLTPQARTRNAVVRTRSLSGRFFVLPPSSFWLGELEPAPLAPPALVIRIVDAPAHP